MKKEYKINKIVWSTYLPTSYKVIPGFSRFSLDLNDKALDMDIFYGISSEFTRYMYIFGIFERENRL